MGPKRSFSVRLLSAALAIVLLCWASTVPAHAQIKEDQQADLLLNTARKAHNDGNFGLATQKFREFIGKYGSHKEVAGARYGLALALIEGPEKKYDEARDLLVAISADKQFKDRPFAVYYAGFCFRAVGLNDLTQAESKPGETAKYLASAQTRFTEAIPHLTAAVTALQARVENPMEGDRLTMEAEWVARARCDLAEMQLRTGKLKEAIGTALPFIADPVWSKSRYRNLGRYYHGYSSVLAKDNIAGQKSLSMLMPFEDPVFGNHARYLLARTFHVVDDRAEASTHYEGVIADYAKSKVDAGNLLRNPEKFKNDPEIRARLEALLRNPTPDHVARATFYVGVLHYEGGKFADAKTRFADFVKQFAQSPLKIEAEMRFGFCQVQLKEYAGAITTLTPLVDKEARLSDQVLFWLGKAQAGAAPDAAANQQAHNQAVGVAITTLRTAAERAQKQIEKDPEAKSRRGEILLEMADQMQRIWQNREAAKIYSQLLDEKTLSDRDEETMQRWTSALHLAGDYAESDKACQKFIERFPQSTLLPAVLFTHAENSFFRIVAAEKNPNVGERAKELPPLYAETITRFQKVIDKYPEFPKINVARYSAGLTFYRKGELVTAQKMFATIPAPERTGELGLTSYLIADCILRQVPTTVPDDALAAGKMEEQLKSAAEGLEAFINGQPKDPNVPDALIKFGLCQQRLAGLMAQPPERTKMYQAARATYERLFQKEFANHPQAPQAIVERAKCIALGGDMNQAINELRRFTTDPLRQTPMAPQAVLQLATYLRAQNKAPEAVDLFAKNRDYLEGILAKDPERGSSMTALLRYHHGVSLREAGKLPEARGVFEMVVKLGLQRPEATEAALRIGQCLKDEGQQRLETARKLRAAAKKPEEVANVQKVTEEGFRFLRDSVSYLEGQADQAKKSPLLQDARARMLYEAAWASRLLAEPEVEAARTALMQEQAKKLNPPSSKFPLPEIPIEKVPLQPSEKKARALYKMMIDEVGDTPIATEARFELAELLSQRNEHDSAATLLNEVLDKEPGQELTEKVRLRMAGIHAAKGNLKAALAQFDAITANPKSPLFGWAHYRAAEALIQNQQYPDAIKRLTMFRDQGQWQNVAGLSDRALVRLGFAHTMEKNWEQSRVSYERLVQAFPNSTWTSEAYYGIGWSMQQQKNYDGAATAFGQVVTRTATELAAKAQLQIGLCRFEQKRYLDAANALLVVPSTYDYPELRAAALLEAGKAYLELNQRDQATKLFERVIREFPDTPWAEAAREKMEKK